ncbi:Oxoglutarate and iron-dependent oxygenase degradation C-term-domain-containing protein [Clohesyomyces aquaticus]|uniref:uS12 prolyl 3,4-dihydroxylase n=1 Tax=Clohesyomyces aquaticus TaxID=1231657 RepID=A0A1Y1ZD21_9PLEO|nr:Oxoglutarate and iron-dependent oxygenase degradation C-term-domain-containing protein [Clohesyomyces aquaticus]
MGKRKSEARANGSSKKRAISDTEAHANFRAGLFDSKVLQQYTDYYASSQPYKHAVIQNLVDDSLLRSVRNEIREHISFTPKETDIYKIHQSGDLANLDGLDDAALRRLPSLLKLRDSLYSAAFRTYLSSVTGSGPLSGKKTDMAVNVYTPGCHLLCHDDVIGSRRVSWILYLLDPDRPWKPEWGGALRLFPTQNLKTPNGDLVKVPEPDVSVVIPPAWNQLSFFTVTPGESFHDVEEVYRRESGDTEEDGGRPNFQDLDWEGKTNEEDEALSADELDFLIKYMNPNYLTPDTVEELAGMFSDESSLRLAEFLSEKFSARLREYLESKDHEPNPSLPTNPFYKASKAGVARPPHKHRFLYRTAVNPVPKTEYPDTEKLTPYDDLVDILFPHPAFTKWISLVTGITLTKSNIYARRFRRGMDYTLATAYEEEDPQLEVCLGITPSKGWGDEEEAEDAPPANAQSDGPSSRSKGKSKSPVSAPDPPKQEDEIEVGGYETYMAGEDDDDNTIADGGGPEPSTHTGAGQRRKAKSKADPAIYKSAADDEDDGVLFSQPAVWNNVSIVLRDRGILRFTKYVSKSAKGDRWDVCAEYGVELGDDEEDEDDG